MFDTLLKTAIIGTANGATLPEIDYNEIALPETISAEEKILLAAAFYALQEKASYQAKTYTHELPAACPQEEQVYASLSICELILRCMSKEQEDSIVVQEILEKIAAKSWIVLPHVLPQLLDYGQSRTHLQHLIAKVSGKRGKWLVNYNKTWKYILADEKETSDWDTDTHEERLASFRLLHKNKPAEAIALLQQDWRKESLKNKKDFLNVLIAQPDVADETFLEALFEEEKDTELCRKVMEVLVQIPHSSVVECLKQHILASIKIKSGFLSVEKMQITLPTALTPDLKKLGFLQTKQGLENSKQGIFCQLLSLFPPSLLTQIFKKTPEEILLYAEKTTLYDIILHALTQAAQLHKDQDWLSALIINKIETKTIPPEMKKMQNALSADSYSKLAEKVAKKTKDKTLLFFLANREQTWAETETQIALTEMQNAVRKYANARPWDCNDFKDIAKTVSIYGQASALRPFSDILHQMSVSKEWEKELKSSINRIDLRIQISIILS